MRRLTFSPGAISDLHAISRYGRLEFGEAQARRYVATIRTVCLKLADGRLVGRRSDNPIPGLRKQRIGSHLIFYHLWKSDVVEIVRILHGKMNFEDHL